MQHSDFLPFSRPVLFDVASCDRWLARERITDSDRACAAFIGLLDQLEDAPPSAMVCVRILERLRAPMHVALEEQSRRYAGKPLPLAPAEAAAHDRSRDLWLAQTRAWRRLLRAGWKLSELAQLRSRLTLRTLESIAGLLTAGLAARHAIAPEHWRWLHQGYEFAEKEDMAECEITGEDEVGALTCNAIYLRVLLLQLANPAALSQREFEWTRQWAARWAGKARLWRSAANGGGLAVDFASDTGARWVAAGTPGATLRFIDCENLRRTIRQRVRKLDAGTPPEALHLGRDCPPFAARELLNNLLRCWSDAPVSRRFPRHDAFGATDLVASFAEIHKAISGGAFEDDFSPWNYTRQQVEQIHLFHKIASAMATQKSDARIERWETVDQSANGFRLRRSTDGSRLTHRQLVAIKPRDASQYILCGLRWLAQGGGDACNLEVGAMAMPGLPQACALRSSSGGPTNGGAWTQAFVLPQPKGLAPNLVIPIGWYQSGRELDMKLHSGQFRVRLGELLERGHDYQRVGFAAISAG